MLSKKPNSSLFSALRSSLAEQAWREQYVLTFGHAATYYPQRLDRATSFNADK
jgi:hypothetical protein